MPWSGVLPPPSPEFPGQQSTSLRIYSLIMMLTAAGVAKCKALAERSTLYAC